MHDIDVTFGLTGISGIVIFSIPCLEKEDASKAQDLLIFKLARSNIYPNLVIFHDLLAFPFSLPSPSTNQYPKTMSRFPPILPSSLTQEQKRAYDEIDAMHEKEFGSTSPYIFKDSTGAMIGPFAPLLFVPSLLTYQLANYSPRSYTPSLVRPSLILASAINSQPALTSRMHELAILAIGAIYGTAYVLYAHSRLALSDGLSAAQISSACKGKTPSDLPEEETVTYEFSAALARERGLLKEDVWERAMARVGREVLAALVNVVGGYSHTCVVVNAGDVGVPESAT